MAEINIGDIVQASYNSGTYIGEVIEDRHNAFLVKVFAVHTHPAQGDLHNPGKVEGVAFHERKALAYLEKMNAGKRRVHPYTGEISGYSESLKKAVNELKQKLTSTETEYNQLAFQKLLGLEEDFYRKLSDY